MNRLHWIVFTQIIVLLAGSLPAWSESKPEPKIEDNFEVKWTSVTYHKIVSVPNPVGPSDAQGPQRSENLSLNCEVVIVDPNLVLGTCWEVKVEDITDGQGERIQTAFISSRRGYTQYGPMSYRRRYVTPPKPSRWKTAVRSALGLSPKESPRSQLVTELLPCRMQIELDVGLTEGTDREIGTLKGHFYVLMAESFEYVELPFEPNDKWVRLTPDLEVRIRDAWYRDSSYHLSAEARPGGGSSTLHLYPESFLPERIVVDRQLIDQDGKRIGEYAGSIRLPFDVRENRSGSGGFKGTIKKVRYKIAVNPMHQKIPFVLENIPLPKP